MDIWRVIWIAAMTALFVALWSLSLWRFTLATVAIIAMTLAQRKAR